MFESKLEDVSLGSFLAKDDKPTLDAVFGNIYSSIINVNNITDEIMTVDFQLFEEAFSKFFSEGHYRKAKPKEFDQRIRRDQECTIYFQRQKKGQLDFCILIIKSITDESTSLMLNNKMDPKDYKKDENNVKQICNNLDDEINSVTTSSSSNINT